jgi:hypothetical protein
VANNNFEKKKNSLVQKKVHCGGFFHPEKLHLYLEGVWDVVAVTFQSVSFQNTLK